MALWHWLAGGAAAYLLWKKTAAASPVNPGTTPGASMTAEQQAATSAYMDQLRNTFATAMNITPSSVNVAWNGAAWELRIPEVSGNTPLVTVKDLEDLRAQIAANPALR